MWTSVVLHRLPKETEPWKFLWFITDVSFVMNPVPTTLLVLDSKIISRFILWRALQKCRAFLFDDSELHVQTSYWKMFWFLLHLPQIVQSLVQKDETKFGLRWMSSDWLYHLKERRIHSFHHNNKPIKLKFLTAKMGLSGWFYLTVLVNRSSLNACK